MTQCLLYPSAHNSAITSSTTSTPAGIRRPLQTGETESTKVGSAPTSKTRLSQNDYGQSGIYIYRTCGNAKSSRIAKTCLIAKATHRLLLLLAPPTITSRVGSRGDPACNAENAERIRRSLTPPSCAGHHISPRPTASL